MATITSFISNTTMTAIEKDIDLQIDHFCEKFKIEKALVRAIIQQESKFNITAMRYEPHLKKAKWYNDILAESEKQDQYSYFSMGLMQIMFGTAKHEGYRGKPFDLINPENSIKYGCKHLKTLIKRYYHLDKVISAYNQGTPRRVKSGGKMFFANQEYVDNVYNYYKTFGGVH